MAFLQTGNPMDALPLLDSISASFNPYPLISQTILGDKDSLAHLHILRFAMILIATHGIILLQTIIIFYLKFKREENLKNWFSPWKKSFKFYNQSFPHLVPNGSLLVDLFQVLTCASMEWFSIVTYRICSKPKSVSPAVHSSSMFWLALSFAPGFIGFWLNGWSSIYVGFFSPSRGSESKTSRYRFVQQAYFMNTICYGIPILILIYFITLGIKMSIKHQQVMDIYLMLLGTIKNLSEHWIPNDPDRFQKNRNIFNIVSDLYAGGNQIGDLFQLLAIGWSIVSLLIIVFYIAATFALAKVIKQSLKFRMAGEKTSVIKQESDSDPKEDSENWGFQSSDVLTCSNYDKEYTLKLQRSYYFIYASSCIISLALGFLIASSVILALKAKVFLIHTSWQAKVSALATCNSVLLSISLLLQSILLLCN